jgi:hypothetical protein
LGILKHLYISDLDQLEILEDWSFFQITLGLLYTILQKNLEFDQTITDDFMANIMKMLKYASMNRDREDLLTCVAMLSMTDDLDNQAPRNFPAGAKMRRQRLPLKVPDHKFYNNNHTLPFARETRPHAVALPGQSWAFPKI